MYRIYVNWNDMVIEEYDSRIARIISTHLAEHNMLLKTTLYDGCDECIVFEEDMTCQQ